MAVVNNRIVNMGVAIAPDNTGDLQVIFGTSRKEKAWFFASADINPFSLSKPFIYPVEVLAIGSANRAARLDLARRTRYGFNVTGQTAPSAGSPWTYQRPNGNLLTQPRRTDDFEGYYKLAPCPFKIEAEVRKGTGAYASIKGYISVILSVNDAVSSLWERDYCMGIKDFFDSAATAGTDDLWDYYHIAFKIVNKSRGSTYAPTVIVTKWTLKDVFTNANYAYFNFPEVTQDQWNYLGILDEASEGDTLEIMAYLNNQVTTQAGHDYEVFTGNAAAFWTAGFSLAFKAGVDRVDTSVMSMYSISGTTGSITSVTNRDDGIVQPTYQGQPMSNLSARAFLNTLVWLIYTAFRKISVSSPGFIERMRPYTRKEIRYIPQWATGIRDLPPREPDGKRVFMFAGNVGSVQNLDNLILAFGKAKCENAELWVVGGGVYLERIKKLAEEMKCTNIVFTGQRPRSEMAHYFSNSDIMIISLIESFDLTLPAKLQAYTAAGRPIFGVVRGDAADMIDEYRLGMTADPADPDSIVRGFEELCRVPDAQLQEWGKNASALSRSQFDRLARIAELEADIQ